MRIPALATLLCAVPALHAQAVEIDLSKKATTADIALLDATGVQSIPEETTMASSSTMMVPFVGIKAKIHFKAPKEIPGVSPVRLLLGKTDPDKTGGVRLARLLEEEGQLTLKAKIVFSLTIDEDCAPFKESDKLKAKQGTDGIWTLDLPKPLDPGTYALVAATGSKSMFGMKIDAKARIFKVPAPAAPSAAAPAPTPAVAPAPTPVTPASK